MEISGDYLAQHYLTHVPNPSDDSDFEEPTYESVQRMEISILHNKSEMEIEKIDKENERRRKAERYVEKFKDSKRSIFNLPGLEFIKYTHKIIKFKMKPIKFSFPGINIKDLICDRTYQITLKYLSRYERWILKKYHVPCKDEILEIFETNVYDKDLEDAIHDVYKALRNHTKKLAIDRQERKKVFSSGEDITLTEDEEKLFLTEKEIERKRKRENEIFRRMLLPEKHQIDNINRVSMNREKEKKNLEYDRNDEMIERGDVYNYSSSDSS